MTDIEYDYTAAEIYKDITPGVADVETEKFYTFEDAGADYNDLNQLNREIYASRKANILLMEETNKAERKHRQSKAIYERKWKRAYLESSYKTDSARKADADIKCEEEENSVIYFEQLVSELKRASYTIRQEMEALSGLSHNVRQQLKVS